MGPTRRVGVVPVAIVFIGAATPARRFVTRRASHFFTSRSQGEGLYSRHCALETSTNDQIYNGAAKDSAGGGGGGGQSRSEERLETLQPGIDRGRRRSNEWP